MRKYFHIISQLARRDFRARTGQTFLGPIWGILQPLIMILLLWFVFEIGLRANLSKRQPYILFLLCGMLPWHYFTESLNQLTRVIPQYAFILKERSFRIQLVPIAKIFSIAIPHLTLVALLFIVCLWYGIPLSVFNVQLVYYFICLIFLITSLGFIVSSVGVFFPDLGLIIPVVLQMSFWITPIMWDVNKIPEQYQWVIKLNPMIYIIEGYRDSVLDRVPFWEHPSEALYFWIFTLVVFAIGLYLFNRLRTAFWEHLHI
jgi:ABC-type polysaccharide/polyol phosphate export permease